MAYQTNPARPRKLFLRAWNPFRAYDRDQKLFITEAMLMNSATVISGGMFLTGLLVLMGADNMTVGLVVSSGSWSMLLSLAASAVMERVRRRKALLAWVALVFRLLTCLPVFLPAVMGAGAPAVAVTAVMVVLGNAVFSLYNTGFTIFFMDSIPIEGRTGYIYTRLLLIRIAYTVLLVAMGFLLDYMVKLQQKYLGFVLVFGVALAIGTADALVLSRIKGSEPDAALPAQSLAATARSLLKPLADRRYAQYLAFTGAYFFFLSVSTAFTSLYQLEHLGLSYAFLSVYSMIVYAIMILMTRAWGRIETRIGRPRMIVLTSTLMAADLLVYGFLTRQTLWLLALSPLLNGLGNSGFWACNLPYRYDLMPEGGKMAYEGWFWFVYGAAGLVGALCGGGLLKLVPQAATPLLTFSPFQLLYLFSGATAIGTSLLYRRTLRPCGEAAR